MGPGMDGIPAEGCEFTTELYRLCNKIWQEEQWPSEWAKSVLVTIPKKEDLTDCANCRTVALILHLSKVLLLIILARLQAPLEPCFSEE